MSALKVGDSFPADVVFNYVPYQEGKEALTSCGVPGPYNASKEWADKKAVLVAVPGAFTPSCSEQHLPGYIEKLDKLKAKGVDVVAVVAYNDPFVMSAWGKANRVKSNDVLFMTDPERNFSNSIGWTFMERTGRYALIIDHGKVTYAEKEDNPKLVTVSGVDAVLAKL
ncbi:Peroxiredoxin Asp f3 [Varicellaria rhodocarpa]|nr:Peroxiredoxin Asp f3 [Varicellaria rhodocarpa]